MLKVKRGSASYISSCVFIAPNIALTAAHSVDKCHEIYCMGVKAKNFIIHPEYNSHLSNYLNDIALVFFDKDMGDYSKISETSIQNIYYRCGHGLRNGENNKIVFKIKLLKSYQKFCLFFDSTSVIGDSGGGVYNMDGDLVGIHSTKESHHIYAARLDYYLDWITPYKNKFDLQKLRA